MNQSVPPHDGGWMLTISGKCFSLIEPNPEYVDIQDIGLALANVCRFGGHTFEFYSVAQHSVLVSHLVPQPLAKEGLLHDATEAYMNDLIRPLKLLLPEYKVMENRLWCAIAERFGLPEKMSCEVKLADDIALATERRDLQPDAGPSWNLPTAISQIIKPVGPREAYVMFMERWSQVQ